MFLRKFRKVLSEIFLFAAKLIYPSYDKKEAPRPPQLKPFHVPTGVAYPASYDLKKAEMLANRVHQAANTYLESKVFQSILRNAYDQAKDLFTLNSLAPQVLKGNTEARDRFEQILEGNIKQYNLPRGRSTNYRGYQRSNTIPRPDRGPCDRFYFIGQDAVYNVTRTISHIAGKEDQYHAYINVVEHIWNRGRCLDDLMGAAFADDKVGRPSRQGALRERLEETAVDNKLYDRHRELDERYKRMPRPRDEEIYPDDGRPGLGNGTIDLGEEGYEKWPPRGPGWEGPLGGCGDKPRPDSTRNPCDLWRDSCQDMVINGSRGLRQIPEGRSETDNIDSIEPPTACAGGQIRILGHGFGNNQGERDVVIGSTPMEVVSWSDLEIVVVVPDGAGPGCIGIRDRQREDERRNIYVENQQILEELNAGLMCLRMESIMSFPYHPTAAPCHQSLNRFEGTVPVIRYFSVNNSSRLEVEPGENLRLTWEVENGAQIRIRRVSGNGPAVNLNNPAGNSHNAGVYNRLQPDTTVYELEASNNCGSVTRQVTVTLDQTAGLAILGVEVTQAIQRFDWNNPAQNNSVPLIARKLTMVRVYVESGVSNGFDWGAGPNVLPDITGTLSIGFDLVPINPGQSIDAQPRAGVNRENLNHSLNFILPVDRSEGILQIDAWVNQSGHASDFYSGRSASTGASTEVSFEVKNRIKLVLMLFRDRNLNLARPTRADYLACLQGARTRFPLPENGYRLYTPEGGPNKVTDADLTTKSGWEDLLDDVDDIAWDHEDHNEIWTALVPNEPTYAWNGYGYEGEEPWYWFDDYPRIACQAQLPATFAHEMEHTEGVDHANCGSPDDVDPNIPTQTEDTGMDVAARSVIPSGTSELMTYCGGESRWISIYMWNILRGRL